jgi:hypothetical protein
LYTPASKIGLNCRINSEFIDQGERAIDHPMQR